ncbi:MAG: GntR family transcriptional regulator [Muribaculum sp.]|nr:GntR family transcriptional regulator [Muribaculum sp.]
MMIVIDYRDKRPLYEQVAEKLAHLIVCGALESNAKLPSVRALAMDLSVNPNTVQRAYAQLEQEGFLYTVVGRGNYVTDSKEWQSGILQSLECELRENLTKAAESGMPKDRVLSLTEEIYREKASGKENTSYD